MRSCVECSRVLGNMGFYISSVKAATTSHSVKLLKAVCRVWMALVGLQMHIKRNVNP